jgi:hypothetical protein
MTTSERITDEWQIPGPWETSPFYRFWGKTIAKAWADPEFAQQVERDPTTYVREGLQQQEGYVMDPHCKFVLHSTAGHTYHSNGTDVVYVLPWPERSHGMAEISILSGGPPDPQSGGGSSGSGGDNGPACCCCSCVCCCC